MNNTPLSTYLAIAPQSAEGAVLRLLIELGIQVVGADEGSLLVLDPSTEELVFAMTVGDRSSEDALRGQRVPLGQGLTGLAAATHEVQLGSPTYSQVQQVREGGQTEGPQAVIAAPMLVADSVVGVITAVSFAQGKRFGSREADLYARVAAVAGVVVQQKQLLNAMQSDAPSAAGTTPEVKSGIEAFILGSVARIAQARPEALGHVAALLQSVEALCLQPTK
jgi:GAF domain-containing protein